MYTCEGGPWESSSNFLCFLVQNFGGGRKQQQKYYNFSENFTVDIIFYSK